MVPFRRVMIVCVVFLGVMVVYWLIAPLFITHRVAEELPMADGNRQASTPPLGATGAPLVAEPQEPSLSPTPAAPVEMTRGTFVGLAGHRAQGTARVVDSDGTWYVRFEDDFTVTNGPDLFVYLGRDGAYDPSTRLGALKGNAGSQNYMVPANLNLSAYDAVWVWCRAFSVPFGKAVFSTGGSITPSVRDE